MSRPLLRGLLVRAIAGRPATTDSNPRREVILIRPDHLGDVLLMTPGLWRLRQALPDWRIVAAVGPWSAGVLRGNPDIDEILEIPFPGFTRAPKRDMAEPYQVLSRWALNLAERHPTAAVVLRDDHWWGAALSARAGIPIRVGSEDLAVSRYLTHRQGSNQGHWAQRNAESMNSVARVLGGRGWGDQLSPDSDPLRFDIPDDARRTAADLLNYEGVTDRYVVVHPGSGARVKLWPAARWAEVARALARQGLRVVVTGSPGEIEQANAIASAAGSDTVSIAGKTDLPTLAAVLRGAALVAGVDSGPLHLASATGAATLRLYGPSNIAAFGPWGPSNRTQVLSAGLACPKCGDLSPGRPEGAGCMTAIRVDIVVEAALKMLVYA